MVAALGRHGITTPFPIQAATIADALAGRDVLGKARTGSGKTLGFGLPTVARLADGERAAPRRPRAVVLVPTRELGMQVSDALEPYAHALGVSLKLVAGGLPMARQVQALERGTDLVVATPGRLADLIRRSHADLSRVETVVIDEADHMADLGFMDELTQILRRVPTGGQRLLFSATLDGDVDRLVADYLADPAVHDVVDQADDARMRHVAFNVAPPLKYALATRIAAREGRTIVFVRTKLAADRVARDMRAAGVGAVALHGDRSQAERNTAIAAFRAGDVPVLVATDVAARGIHVDHVDLVLQVDPPSDPKDYTHRSGRTARAGAEGLAVTLILPHQRRAMDRVVESTGADVLFRKIREWDASAIELVDGLTGAREPSGVPVEEPVAPQPARPARHRRPGAGGEGRPARRGHRGHERRDVGPERDRAGARDGRAPQRPQGSPQRDRGGRAPDPDVDPRLDAAQRRMEQRIARINAEQSPARGRGATAGSDRAERGGKPAQRKKSAQPRRSTKSGTSASGKPPAKRREDPRGRRRRG